MPRISASERTATRRRLIDAGKAEFATRGLAGARFDEISLAAGHAKGTIYNYFSDKETLFFTVVEEWCALLVAGFVSDPGRSATDDLREITRLDVEIARKDPDLARVVIDHLPALTMQHASAIDRAVGTGIDLLVSVIERGHHSGEFVVSSPAPSLARMFLSVLSAFEHEALISSEHVSLDDVPSLMERFFIAGLRNESGSKENHA